MRVFNIGSLNIDHVYRVASIARPGETLASSSYCRFPGGKGANQTAALARAGAAVQHVGCLGPEGVWLRDRLASEGANVDHVRILDVPGGHAVIQVEDSGQNSIVIFGGANQAIQADHVAAALATATPGDVLLLQNETNGIPAWIQAGNRAGMRVVLNPAPMTPAVLGYPLDKVSLLIVNEHEGAALADGAQDADGILRALAARLPGTDVCLTMGARGAVLARQGRPPVCCAAPVVQAVDTTAAGDTFIGYLLAALLAGADDQAALLAACRAAAVSVTRPGAMDSIPRPADVDAFFKQHPSPGA